MQKSRDSEHSKIIQRALVQYFAKKKKKKKKKKKRKNFHWTKIRTLAHHAVESRKKRVNRHNHVIQENLYCNDFCGIDTFVQFVQQDKIVS